MKNINKIMAIKCEVSDCICRITNFLDKSISEDMLNLLANEYTDRIIKAIENNKKEK